MRKLPGDHPDVERAQALPELARAFSRDEARIRREAERAVAHASAPLVIAVLERAFAEFAPRERIVAVATTALTREGVEPGALSAGDASASAHEELLRAVAHRLSDHLR